MMPEAAVVFLPPHTTAQHLFTLINTHTHTHTQRIVEPKAARAVPITNADWCYGSVGQEDTTLTWSDSFLQVPRKSLLLLSTSSSSSPVLVLRPSFEIFINKSCFRWQNRAHHSHLLLIADNSNRAYESVPKTILDHLPLLFVLCAYARAVCTCVLPKYHITHHRLWGTKVAFFCTEIIASVEYCFVFFFPVAQGEQSANARRRAIIIRTFFSAES